ncbi:MAG: acetylornithine/succinylornithine family transaminase [Gemmatimonadetes bacterium]|nr:acetylornithine/succinylornithine family transaminase [Gemmatimonadota bacterium]
MSATSTAGPPLLQVYRPAAPLFVAGSGCWLIDEAGRRYLDFTSGIAVNALGHGTPVVADAIRSALDTGLVHASNLYRTAPAEELAAWLVDHSFAAAVFFCNSGAEANEAAIKFARRWARAQGGEDKHEIVALRGGFHGRTLGALSVTDRSDYREPFTPLVPGVRFVDPREPGALEAALDAGRTAAVIAEPIQAEGGVRPLGAALLRRLREACDAADALLVLDEVQVGLGRTGTLWAHEAAGITPDIMTLAKPLAGGLPMGATLVSEEVASAIRPGDHGSTFGGGPLVARVALAVCRTIGEPTFLASVRARSAQLDRRLASMARRPDVLEVRGEGLLRGVEIATSVAAITERALGLGLLVCAAGPSTVRLLPPLTIGAAELDRGMDLLDEALGC